MRRVSGLALALLMGPLAWAVACGGASPSRATSSPGALAPRGSFTGPEGRAPDGGAETFGEVDARDLAEVQGGVATKPPASPASPPSAPPPPESEPASTDECAPVARAFERSTRSKIRECYREGKKKDPNLTGSIKIGLEVDGLGKAKPAKILESTLPKDVSACMLKAVKATPLPEASKCPNKSLAIPVTFPTP